MGGGLMQLVAYGAQDIYLTGNPQITFFKVVYRRHTNFSMEAIEQTWNGTSNANGRCSATISRNGDLVYRMFLDVDGTGKANIGNPGNCWIKTVTLEIGGQQIDRHSGVWMETWSELTQPNPGGTTVSVDSWNAGMASAATAGGTIFQTMSGTGGVVDVASSTVANRFNVPLYFWFCRNAGLALPLIALQYHEVKVILDHNIGDAWTSPTLKLWADYIYLDTDERRRFAQVSHEYLIEQVQEQSLTAGTTSVDLNFNHPVKELLFTAGTGSSGSITGTELSAIDATESNSYGLKLNGHDRMAVRPLTYFTRTQVWQHHTSGGLNSSALRVTLKTGFNDSIGVYSFALKPEEHQPSGTCNFSRIDNAQFVNSDGGTIVANALIFAVNYNVLRIMSGMGGLAYSN